MKWLYDSLLEFLHCPAYYCTLLKIHSETSVLYLLLSPPSVTLLRWTMCNCCSPLLWSTHATRWPSASLFSFASNYTPLFWVCRVWFLPVATLQTDAACRALLASPVSSPCSGPLSAISPSRSGCPCRRNTSHLVDHCSSPQLLFHSMVICFLPKVSGSVGRSNQELRRCWTSGAAYRRAFALSYDSSSTWSCNQEGGESLTLNSKFADLET